VIDSVKKMKGRTGFQPVRKFKSYRRNLPHWESPGYIYFVTFSTKSKFTLSDEGKDKVFKAWLYHENRKYTLFAMVIMPDHVHSLFQPLEKHTKEHRQDVCDTKGFYSLAEILHSIKSYSSNEINKIRGESGTVWLDEYYDRIVRNEKDFHEKLRYIIYNPVKSGLVNSAEKYQWLYVKSWLE
jgi:REP element-mobilizing transposase RayT